MSHSKRHNQSINSDAQSVRAADIEEAFRVAIKKCACPACGIGFTDRAVEWVNAWREGYVDRIREDGQDIRDGPLKIRCENCGQ